MTRKVVQGNEQGDITRKINQKHVEIIQSLKKPNSR